MKESPSQRYFLALGLAILAGTAWWYLAGRGIDCVPSAAETLLSTYRDRGIEQVHHPPSLSNLLWITVGPEWHELSKQDKDTIDKIVRCAATVIDDLGQPTWQAAYYDTQSGKLVALTSKQYGFRLKSLPDS